MPIQALTLPEGPLPIYQRLAAALTEAIVSGALAAGERLPPHRELARALGVARGTVQRGYRELEARGLVRAGVGSGTYVAGDRPLGAAPDEGDLIDLARNGPLSHLDPDLRPALRALADGQGLAPLTDYRAAAGGVASHRAAGARWLARCGAPVVAERVRLTVGSQHALLVSLAACSRPGQAVAAAELTYPGLRAAAEQLGLEVVPLALDSDGIRPEALAAAAEDPRLTSVYCVPSGQTPTGGVMPPARRTQIAGLVRERKLTLIEDAVHALIEGPPAISAQVPDRALLFAGLSKSVSAGLRVAYLLAPEPLSAAVDRAIRASVWFPTPLAGEIARRWIEDGTAEATIARKRAALAERAALAREQLGGLGLNLVAGGLFGWLPTPAGISSAEFVAEARRRRVSLTAARPFALGAVPGAVRVCLGGARDLTWLGAGLARVAETYRALSEPASLVV